MKRALLLIGFLFLPGVSHALNLSYFYCSDGGDRIPKEKYYPHGVDYSSSTYSRYWDGITCTPFSARGETRGFDIVAIDTGVINASSVTVTMSSMTCAGSTGIVSVVVSSVNVMDFSSRPIQVFSAWYVPIRGLSTFPYGKSEFEERMWPLDFRVPYTVSGSNVGVVTTATDFWVNRPFHDLNLPSAWVPEEEFLISSETVSAGNSHTWHVDVFVSSSIPAGQCTGTLKVFEGPTLSTAMPVNWKVYDALMPAQPGMMELVCASDPDIDLRQNGNGTPALPLAGKFLEANQNYSKMLRAHGMIRVCDSPDVNANEFPSTLAKSELDGSLYTAVNGYGNARGLGLPVPFYMIGAYESWHHDSAFSSTNASQFSTAVSSWAANIGAINPTAKIGLYGQDEVSDMTTNEKWATWVETNTTYGSNPHVHMFVTGDLPIIAANAPHVAYPTSNRVFANGLSNSSVTWQTKANSYEASSSSMVGRYNGGAVGFGANTEPEEEAYVGEANYWAYWKKLCPTGVCKGFHFEWEGVYFNDSNETHLDSDLFNDAKTFGYSFLYTSFTVNGITTSPSCDYLEPNGRQMQMITSQLLGGVSPNIGGAMFMFQSTGSATARPVPPASGTLTKVAGQCAGSACSCFGDSTIAYSTFSQTLVHPQWGRNGFLYTNQDGVIMLPGTDTVFANPSFTFNGPIATLSMKKMRDGLGDVDYLNLAATVNPSSTTALVAQMFPSALWEVACHDASDCSYYLGDRTWSYGANNWTVARERALMIVAVATTPVVTSALTASGQVGVPFSYQIIASSSPTSYSASPLPTGLSVNGAGLISGTPTTVAVISATVYAANPNGNGPPVTVVFTISAAPPGGTNMLGSVQIR